MCEILNPTDKMRENETLADFLNSFYQILSKMKNQLRKSSVLIETIKYQNVIASVKI